jgi:trehalose 6-phosphate synthase
VSVEGFDNILVASNRGPVTFNRSADGTMEATRGSGGLVTALTGSMRDLGGTWVAAAMSDGDREVAAAHRKGRIGPKDSGTAFGLRYLTFDPEVFDGYYNYVSNGILWFAYHYLWDAVHSPIWNADTEAAWERYVAVNRAFAEALANEASRSEGKTAFMIHDYHLSLVPRFLRELLPEAAIAHFSHTPFSGPTYTRIMPAYMRREILRGLLGADVLGFHAEGWAENFMVAARYVPGVRADLNRSRVHVENREVMVRIHPISIDAGDLRSIAADPDTLRIRDELLEWKGKAKLILRVDRMELSKNVWRGFLAYEMLLRTAPQWRGNVKFLALLSPSRAEIPEYREYTELCLSEAERINGELGKGEWKPIEIRMQDDYVGAIAAYGIYDVLLVNPVYDGMNLVAMEGPLVNRKKGCLVLSRNAGAYSRLGRHAIGVNPFDVKETAEAIERALTMPEEERARRARGLSRLVLSNPPARWVGRQLDDLRRAEARRAWFAAR